MNDPSIYVLTVNHYFSFSFFLSYCTVGEFESNLDPAKIKNPAKFAFFRTRGRLGRFGFLILESESQMTVKYRNIKYLPFQISLKNSPDTDPGCDLTYESIVH